MNRDLTMLKQNTLNATIQYLIDTKNLTPLLQIYECYKNFKIQIHFPYCLLHELRGFNPEWIIFGFTLYRLSHCVILVYRACY